jgi:two-component system chemotaxis sensor kinase CheA
VSPKPEGSFLERFLAEAKEHLATISAAMIALEKSPAEPRQTVEPLLRAAHSIKGGAAFSGRRNIEQLAHAMEEVAERIRDGELSAGPETIDTLLHVVDRITALVDDLEHSDQVDVSDAIGRLSGLLAGRDRQAKSLVKAAGPGDGAKAEQDLAATRFEVSPGVLSAYRPDSGHLLGIRLDLVNCEAAQHLRPAEVFTRVEKLAKLLESQTRTSGSGLRGGRADGPLWWIGIVLSPMDAEGFRDALGIPSAQVVSIRQATANAAKAGPTQEKASDGPAAGKARPGATSLRVSVSLIDRMMSLTGELVLVRNQALRSGDRMPLRSLLRRLDAVTNDLQDAALGMRTQPVGTLFDRFPRMVRDLARQLGKQIELTVSGSEVELDKTIIELLADPLTHLIRNCCDHGIESPEKRVAAGKVATGSIHLSARQERGQIVIEVNDDGKGINTEAVKRKALERKVRRADELERMTPRQINELVLLSGFSTAAEVTDVSGRGVGMDVVKTNIDQVGGLVEIDSVPGKGTVFCLRLPLTLAIMPCLLVDCGEQLYAIPQRDIEEILLLDGKRRTGVERDEFGEVIRWRDRLLPVARLRDVLHGPAGHAASVEASYAAVTRLGSRRFALIFDRVRQSENIVVKPLPKLMRPLGIYSATTILGDGSVALILNSDGVARRSGVLARAASGLLPTSEPQLVTPTRPVLLFRSAGGERLAVDLSAVRRIVHFRKSEIQRVGGRELLTVDEVAVNLIRLESELGLSAAGDSESLFLLLPRDRSVPVGLLAAKIDDTLELTSPVDPAAFPAEGLLGTVLVDGEIALMIDLPALVRRFAGRHLGVSQVPALETPTAPRVLLVEDTAFFQKLIADYLRSDGFEVTVAAHGQQAIELLETGGFDVIVSDIEMPVMDGMRLARAIREHPKHRGLPLLALTTLDTADCRSQAARSGFNAFQVKLDRQMLLSGVRSLLQAKAETAGQPLVRAGGARG